MMYVYSGDTFAGKYKSCLQCSLEMVQSGVAPYLTKSTQDLQY